MNENSELTRSKRIHIQVLNERAKTSMTRLMRMRRMPECIVLGRDFNPTYNNLRRLAYILVIGVEIKHLVGEVTPATWPGVSRVLITVAECRRKPLNVQLRTVDLVISPEQRQRYVACLASVARRRRYSDWQIEPYSDDNENRM